MAFLANNLHLKVIYNAFQDRNLVGYPVKSTDVYIDGGRDDGYNWIDNYWSTQDLWVKVAPYANDADQQAGGLGDHVEPPVGSLAYL